MEVQQAESNNQFHYTMTINDISDDTFKTYVAESKTWTELLTKCGYNNKGNKKYVVKRIENLGLDINHLPKGQNWADGEKRTMVRYTLEDILVANSAYASMTSLKNRLKKELNWEHQCHSCKLTEWLGNPIPLEIEHKNGIHNDNRIENLAFLCPNCHALTDTYKGKNVKTYKDVEQKQTNTCLDCKKDITKNSFRCEECQKIKARVVERPSYEQLKKELTTSNYLAMGRKYSVSDNTIRKWMRWYEKREVKQETEDELNNDFENK